MPRKVAFLDRDGTINVDLGYVFRTADWQFTKRAAESIRRLRSAGYAVAVITNQSGIAAGYYTLEDLESLHRYMNEQLAMAGTQVDAVAFCPHGAAENCACRKPRTGMSRHIEEALGEPVDYSASWTIGDKTADMEFGRALGTRTVLLRSRYWSEADLPARPDLIADSLYLAVERILAREPADVVIRPERTSDFEQIAEVNRLAFGREDEAQLITALRQGGYGRLSLVAVVAGQFVGHIYFSRLPIITPSGVVEALSLAPMAVHPSFQRKGIGTRLVEEGLRLCAQEGHVIVLVLGHSGFYPRFGFSPKLAEPLDSPFGGRESWMALELVAGSLAGVAGRVEYPPPFGIFG